MRAYERLMRYAAVRTPSDEESAAVPSTPEQYALAAELAEEMKALGLRDILADEHAYVYGRLPASPGYENSTPIGFIAHIDTVPVPEGARIRPMLVKGYDGGELPLGTSGLRLSPAVFPHLSSLAGEDLVVTDGTTVLGADDKAGVAEIMTAMERLIAGNAPHGPVSVCFTPDEEIGHGAALLDLERFGAKYAYTLDGSDVDEVEFETFNAASAKWEFRGVEVHPGSAKGVMVNASLMAAELVSSLPADETPAATEGYEGFYHLGAISGDVGHAVVSYILRDHDRERFEARKRTMRELEHRFREKYGEEAVRLELRDQYYNMAEVLRDCPEVLEKAREAIRAVGLEPVSRPVRGGTDGSQLSFRGLPCPNLGTGGFCFHGPYEHASVQRMDRAVEIILGIIGLYAEQ